MRRMAFHGGANASVQSRINVSIVFNYLRGRQRSYRAQIARELGLSAPAVSRAIEQLTEKGYLVENGVVRSAGGKKATGVEINARKGSVIAVDPFKEHLKIAAFDLRGRILVKWKGRRYAESKDVAGDLIEDIDHFLALTADSTVAGGHTSLPEVCAICVGIPAAIDSSTGRVCGAYLYESLEGLDPKPQISDHYGIETFIENDVKLAALAENRLGEGKTHRNLVYVDVSDGIAAGIIVENQIVRGAAGFAGEIGYTLPSAHSLDRSGVTKGYLENHASVEAMRTQAIAAIERGGTSSIVDHSGGTLDAITGEAVFEAANEGDEIASAIVKQSVDLLTHAVLNAVLVVNPEVVVIGGDIYEMPGVRDLFITPMRRKLNDLVPFSPPEITLSSLGADSSLLGAALFGVDSHLSKEYPYHPDGNGNPLGAEAPSDSLEHGPSIGGI